MKVLVFDTETTGLPEGKNPSIYDHDKWPHVIQFSFILYDIDKNIVMGVHDYIISIGKKIPISPKSIEIHGITRKISENNGISIKDALVIFNICLNKADVIIGHNISFDKRLLMVESFRNNVPQYFTVENKGKPEYCTMKNGTNICKIEVFSTNGESYYKYPTLMQLHQHLFETIPKGLHNSLVDVLVCLRCYYSMIYGEDICKKGRKISAMLKKALS